VGLVALGALTITLLTVALVHERRGIARGALAPLGHIPTFTMPDQRGVEISDAALRGETLVVDFFFASCTTSCPILTAQMATVEHAVADRERQIGRRLPVHLVSITLDPENDTPDVLAEYAGRYGAVADRWSFLSGRSVDLDRVVIQGFKTAFQRSEGASGIATIMHGEWLVLVDSTGAIRGYYAARDPERMTGLVHDVLSLAGAGDAS
jgi:protein SCO1/2